MEQPRIIHFKHIYHNQADLSVAEENQPLPFQIKRVYWLTNVPEGQIRGNNATLTGKRIISCIHGSVKIDLESIEGSKTSYDLDNPSTGLYIPNLYWSRIHFASESMVVCLVSNTFDSEDYIRDHDDFLAIRKQFEH